MCTIFQEIKFTKDVSSYSVVRECMVNFEFEDVNKGFEGFYYFEKDGDRFFMGLCESESVPYIIAETS